jgi:hypothetical protein
MVCVSADKIEGIILPPILSSKNLFCINDISPDSEKSSLYLIRYLRSLFVVLDT